MSDPIFERYKELLRVGHVALLRGRLDEAAVAYQEAASLAPDRALPRAGLGGVRLRAGDPEAALRSYDEALARAPADDGAINGRAQALVVLRRSADAAAAYERLAVVRREAQHLGDACDALRRALEIEPTPARRALYYELAGELRVSAGDAEAERALGRALRLLAEEPSPPSPPASSAAAGAATGGAGAMVPGTTPGTDERTAGGPPPAPPASAAPEGDTLLRDAESAADRGEIAAAVTTGMAAVRAHEAAGQPLAALDACLRIITVAPESVELHLLLAELEAERGWHEVAAEKYRHLVRLAELDGDAEAAGRIRAMAQATLPDAHFAGG